MGRGQQRNNWDVGRSYVETPGKDLRKRRTVLLVTCLVVLFPYMYYYSTPYASTKASMFLQRRPASSGLVSTNVEENENTFGTEASLEQEDSTSSQDVNATIVGSDSSNNEQNEGNTDAMAENTVDSREVAIHVNETSSTLGSTEQKLVVDSQDVNDTMVGSDPSNNHQPEVVDTENNGHTMAEKEVISTSPNTDNGDWKQTQVPDEEPDKHQQMEANVISLESPNTGVCDLMKGSWVPDSRPPQYTNSTCRFIQEHQNCMKNGRRDMGYLHWKWQPEHCDLPRIDATAFLNNMRDKSMHFVGDSLARNQFQSLLCLLSQAERPDHTHQTADDKDNIYVFPSHNFTLAIFASTHLVHVEDKLVTWPDNSTLQVAHVHLDQLDRAWVDRVPGVDFLQISTGQWWFKKALFYVSGTPIGCHWWEGDGYMLDGWKECSKVIGFADPYRMAIHNALQGSLSVPGYTGTTILRSFAPDHFEDGQWHNGGKCVRTSPGGVSMSDLTRWMREIQLQEFQNVTGALNDFEKKRIRLLDITHLAQIRADGHPDAYRNFQPFSKESKQPVQKDCLHWCLPGPIDTWNDLLVESLLQWTF